ncbi:MAG: penicillin amidase [Nocardioidaceae bacterium]|nr:penicillin amidase [Nocardioidaceae bacterium]
MTFTLKPVDPVADLDLIHDWVTQDRARFWGMTEHTRAEVGEVYAYLDTLTSHHAYLARDGETPVAIFQTYEPEADPLGEFYDVRAGDLGVHLFIAPSDEPVTGFSQRLVARLTAEVFADPSVLRLVIEPDMENSKSVALLSRAGFEWDSIIDLPHKKARLGFLSRTAYEAR